MTFVFYSDSLYLVNKTRDKRFKKDYSKRDILEYIKGVSKYLGHTPSFREIDDFPGPSARTIVRRFSYWNAAIKQAGLRPQVKQLLTGERTYIRENWRKMTDKKVAKKLGTTSEVIKYYRMNFDLWKNKKGTARSTFRKQAIKLYGESCESCGVKFCEWHHFVPRSKDSNDWCILCPTCHAAVTRRLVKVERRSDIHSKLAPFVQKLYSGIKFNSDNGSSYT